MSLNIAYVEYNKDTNQYEGGYMHLSNGCGECEFDTRQEVIDWIETQSSESPHFFGLKVIYNKVWQNYHLKARGYKK